MQLRTAALFCLLLGASHGLILHNYVTEQASLQAELASEQQALSETLADELRFWNQIFAEQENILMELQASADQNASTLVANSSAPKNATKKAPVVAAKPTSQHHKSPLAGVKLNLNPKSALDLVPALAMLKAMYDDGKKRIGELNARESNLKQRFEEKETTHKERLARIEESHKKGKLNAEFYTNETRDENRMWKYWEGCRERQHRQFHTSLKIQHGTMSKVKNMIQMYENAITGKADAKTMKKDLAKVSGGGMPEIVFVQTAWKDTSAYCTEALKELETAKDEFERQRRSDGLE